MMCLKQKRFVVYTQNVLLFISFKSGDLRSNPVAGARRKRAEHHDVLETKRLRALMPQCHKALNHSYDKGYMESWDAAREARVHRSMICLKRKGIAVIGRNLTRIYTVENKTFKLPCGTPGSPRKGETKKLGRNPLSD